ncbi:MAG: hypothetical protein ABSA52_22635 [Candidatus Binatia bacterium]|jgi:hypothetical protein
MNAARRREDLLEKIRVSYDEDTRYNPKREAERAAARAELDCLIYDALTEETRRLAEHSQTLTKASCSLRDIIKSASASSTRLAVAAIIVSGVIATASLLFTALRELSTGEAECRQAQTAALNSIAQHLDAIHRERTLDGLPGPDVRDSSLNTPLKPSLTPETAPSRLPPEHTPK